MSETRCPTLMRLAAMSIVRMANGTTLHAGSSDWVQYTEEANGDRHFFDASRVEKIGTMRRVWNRVLYKTSIMGASSFQSLLEIDCTARTEKILQSTFFTDPDWENPAMATDMSENPKTEIALGSATQHLTRMVCD